jgi:hypothetical protein
MVGDGTPLHEDDLTYEENELDDAGQPTGRVRLVALAPGAAPPAGAIVHVRGYYRANGTYVNDYYRRAPGTAGAPSRAGSSRSRRYGGRP